MKTIKILLFVWGMICLGAIVKGAIEYPIVKINTPGALAIIEQDIIKKEELNSEEVERFELAKSSILNNYKGLERSAKLRQQLLYITAGFNVLVCIFLLLFMKRAKKWASRL